MDTILANIVGPDLLIVGAIIILLFGGSQLPKLAKGLGQAKSEFEKAQKEEPKDEPKTVTEAKPAAATETVVTETHVEHKPES